jgi:hypothetical protein
VIVRTGRASTVLALVFCSQPATSNAIAGNSSRLRTALRLTFE